MTETRPEAMQHDAAPRNGLEAQPLARWICTGRQRDGGRCTQVLMEVGVAVGRVRIRCPRCGTWHEREWKRTADVSCM